MIPSELVIDHSVITDVFGTSGAFAANAKLEFFRNKERYQRELLRWAQQAFSDFLVRPPIQASVTRSTLSTSPA
ncbi:MULTISPECIES: hypothetical protein [Arthrobacter]|uniref:hypothetical protein n=1 Tax=Arthrobacter TaxID=1663 RepID=UPI001858E180|nr:hypothetical protein [Arthrobacter psychrochitiniphilus]NYG17209.1 aconitase A [Arthrobacter psychrochitiniphilus]